MSQNTQFQEPPYPPDTRAKGWRFEVDHERIRQSDSWALASPEVRPWFLMLWMVAWEQTPCGSLPNDDALIAARIGMPTKTFAKHRHLLMRGWAAASDGRLYHHVITLRVLEMVAYRAKEAARRSKNRGSTAVVPPLSRGTDAEHDRDDTASPGTGTSTSTYTSQGDKPLVKGARSAPPAFDPFSIELPSWLPLEQWAMWVRHRVAIKKPLKTRDHADACIKTLDGFRAQGIDPEQVITHAVASGNQGLFAPPGIRRAINAPNGRHAGFGAKDYREGVTEDGTFT